MYHSYSCQSNSHNSPNSFFIPQCITTGFSLSLPKKQITVLFSCACFHLICWWCISKMAMCFYIQTSRERWHNISVLQMSTTWFRLFKVKLRLLLVLILSLHMNKQTLHHTKKSSVTPQNHKAHLRVWYPHITPSTINHMPLCHTFHLGVIFSESNKSKALWLARLRIFLYLWQEQVKQSQELIQTIILVMKISTALQVYNTLSNIPNFEKLWELKIGS